jgi:hypothetical protein
MNRFVLALAVTGLAVGALITLVPVPWPISVMGEVDAERIRQFVPHHLVNPSRINVPLGGDMSWTWLILETKVRIILVALAWVGLMILGELIINNRRDPIARIGDGSS